MRRIKAKLENQRGASLLIALLFFFMAAMVGAVVLASATASVDRGSQRAKEQQDYLALSSAVSFLRVTFDGLQATAWEEQWKFGCAVAPNIVTPAVHTDKEEESGKMQMSGDAEEGDEKLQKLLLDTAYRLFRSQAQYITPATDEPDPVLFEVAGENLPKVQVRMSMTSSYSVSLELKVENSSESATMTLKATLPPLQKTQSNITCEHDCRFTVPLDGELHTYVENTTLAGTVYTNTQTVSWARAIVVKGVYSGG